MMMETHGMAEFWRGRQVLLTGHTGFKGAWMSLWLKSLGAEVTGYALAPAGDPNLWSIVAGSARAPRSLIADIRVVERIGDAVAQADPQIVIHMAAQALVRESYRDPLGTYATNVMGTAALLQACRTLRRLECVVVVTGWAVMIPTATARPVPNWSRPVFATAFLPTGRRSPPPGRAMSSGAEIGRRIASFPTASGR
jgi:nucleoside-diphosphate-sugar epimerase